MKGLLIKDFRIVLNQKRFLVMAVVFAAVFVFTTDDVSFAATYIQLMLSLISLTTVSYDEYNNGMLFLMTLPVDRKIYVKEKYIFTFLGLVTAEVLAFTVCTIMGAIAGLSTDVGFIAGTMLGMALMLAVTLPLELKFGSEKGRIVMIVAAAIVALAAMGGYGFITEVLDVDVQGFLTDLVNKLPAQQGLAADVIFSVVMLALGAAVLFISYLISAKIMKKKEF